MNTNKNSEAYHTGFEARVQGEPLTANPYPAGTVDSENWAAGWCDAYDLKRRVACEFAHYQRVHGND